MWALSLLHIVGVSDGIGLSRRRNIEVDGGKDKIDVRAHLLWNRVLCASDMRSARWRVLISVVGGVDCDERMVSCGG